jgi:putative intracellular protease/amidase
MNVLMVLTSHGQLGQTGKKTGFWLDEFAAPFYVFKDAGAHITLASPLGGQPPIDPASETAAGLSVDTERFANDASAQVQLAHTLRLGSLKASDFDTLFYPCGHGPLWDLAEDADSQALIAAMVAEGKPVGAVCHAPGVFRHVKKASGKSLLKGCSVTGFSNTEEAAVGLTNVVPFLVEDMLKAAGANYSKGPDWQSHVVVDCMLVTGQNPASSKAIASESLRLLSLLEVA